MGGVWEALKYKLGHFTDYDGSANGIGHTAMLRDVHKWTYAIFIVVQRRIKAVPSEEKKTFWPRKFVHQGGIVVNTIKQIRLAVNALCNFCLFKYLSRH